ncbi:Choline transporter-like protein [Thalictrum thalictroides]|uniref:Choline transporter-like protein n=1 Tax=Thalictrum thalictroides TaxID=46969 RepID=A0A7J6VPE9_THATH|nr:Choline transporter-like protein [Thalictrum thalictroides]
MSSDLSAPPDIRNWFSSYDYESLVLDTEDEIKCFISEESDIENVGFDSEEQNLVQTKIPASSCSLSIHSDLSEPPDIKNWFSSYVYKSPVLDTEDEFKCLVSGKSGIEKVGFDSEAHSQMGTKDNCLLQRPFVANGCDDESFGGSLKGRNDPPQLVGCLTSCMNNSNLMKDLDTSCSSPKYLHDRNNYKEDASEGNSCTKETDYRSNTDLERVNRSPFNISLSCCNDNGKEVNECAANGFISTKKRTNENARKFFKDFQENHTRCVKAPRLNLPLNEVHTGIERSPLYDRTNVSYKMTVPENTGKWRCPQKGKPDLGPPLKQLRLTQWVRRVQ